MHCCNVVHSLITHSDRDPDISTSYILHLTCDLVVRALPLSPQKFDFATLIPFEIQSVDHIN